MPSADFSIDFFEQDRQQFIGWLYENVGDEQLRDDIITGMNAFIERAQKKTYAEVARTLYKTGQELEVKARPQSV